jgi:large subunit ribosomal protein L49
VKQEPQPTEGKPQRAFIFIRTKSDNYPVFTDFKNGRTRELTVLRKYRGDVEAITKELSALFPESKVVEKVGRIEISGLHTRKVVSWMKSLGF